MKDSTTATSDYQITIDPTPTDHILCMGIEQRPRTLEEIPDGCMYR
jgi:hypothetical protein